MVISRLKIIMLVFCSVVAGGISVWLLMPASPEIRTIESLPTTSRADSDRQKRVKEFFGARQEYDMKGGQDMRPRW